LKENADKIVEEDIARVLDDIKGIINAFENTRVLVVGGRGFIGTYFWKTFVEINKILKNPAQIVVVDNLRTAKETGPIESPNIEFIEADISKTTALGYFDYIIYASGIASPTLNRKYPVEAIDANYQGIRNLLETTKDRKPKAVLYLSSAEVYGDPAVVPTPETYWGNVNSLGARSAYDESKRLGETVCIAFWQKYGVPTKIVRPFNVYGPYLNLDDGRVFPDFMRDAIRKSEIVILSDGTPTRSFCYISDALRAFFKILVDGPPGTALNVGTMEEISMKDVAEKIKKVIDKPIKIRLGKTADSNYTKDNPQRRCPDITKAKEVIGYSPKVFLEEGLKRSYNWYVEMSQ